MCASNRHASRRIRSTHRALEGLERRTLMCALPHRHDNPVELRPDLVGVTQEPGGGGPDGGVANIIWENRGDDDFEVFGTNANLARAIVDQVILDWEAVIQSFNYSDGSTTFEVNIEVDGDNGTGGSGGTNSTLGGKPKSGSVNIAPGDDGAGSGWYFDPNPDDHSEFTGSISHAYTAFATSGTAASRGDLYTVVAAEIAHALGLGTDEDGWNDRTTNTNIADTSEGGGTGFFYTFVGPSISHLMTSNNAGPASGGGEDWGEAVHTAGTANINFNGQNWRGVDDAGNASYETGVRYLVPHTVALMFQDAYGYTIRPQHDHYYSDLNESTGVLTIRGGAGASADTISINRHIDRFFRVSVDLGTDVAGTGALPGAGNLPAFVSGVYDPNQITQIVIEAGAGNDVININYVNEVNDLTINCGTGNDTVNFAQATGNMDDVLGIDLVVNGQGDTDTLALFDTANTRDDGFLVTNLVMTRAGFLNIIDHSQVENLRLNAGGGDNAISVTSLSSAQNLIANGGNGDDTFNVGGNTNNVGNVLGAVTLSGQGGTGDTLNYNDSANASVGHTYTLGSISVTRTGAPLTSYFTTETINLNAGSAGNTINLTSTASGSGTTVNGNGGADTVNVGLSAAAVLTVNGGDADDTVNLNNIGSLSGIVVINGNAGALDTLNYNDGNNSTNAAYELNAAALDRTGAVTVFYGTFERVVVNAGIANNTIDVEGGAAGTSMTINAGDGNDDLRVTFANGNLSLVDAAVTFNGDAGANTASLYDNLSAALDSYAISATQVTRPGFGGLTYASIGGLALTASGGSNDIAVNATAATTPVTINAGNGNDDVTVGGGDVDGNIRASVLVNGNAGTDTITFDDTADALGSDTYTINTTTLRKITGGTTSWSTAESVIVNGSNNNDLYEILATVAGVPLTINGRNGSDQFQIGAIGNGNLNSLPGAVTLQGELGSDTVTLHDSGSTAADNYAITETTITHALFGGLTYGGMEGVVLHASSGGNVIDARAGFLCPVTLNAAGGTDTINVNETGIGAVVRINASTGNDAVRVNPDGAGQAFAHFMQTQRVGQLSISSGGTAVVPVGADKVLTMSGLSIAGTGGLNVTDNDVIIDYAGASPLGAITSLLATGYNNGGWLGAGGITSSAAALNGNGRTGVGIAEAGDLFSAFPATFSGQPVDNTAVLLKYTAYGDTNLDGTVNLIDFNRLAANFGTSARRWIHGDTNFDGTVNLFDFNRLAANFGATGFLPSPEGGPATGGEIPSLEERDEALGAIA